MGAEAPQQKEREKRHDPTAATGPSEHAVKELAFQSATFNKTKASVAKNPAS